jgi:hypothetical protein
LVVATRVKSVVATRGFSVLPVTATPSGCPFDIPEGIFSGTKRLLKLLWSVFPKKYQSLK